MQNVYKDITIYDIMNRRNMIYNKMTNKYSLCGFGFLAGVALTYLYIDTTYTLSPKYLVNVWITKHKLEK